MTNTGKTFSVTGVALATLGLGLIATTSAFAFWGGDGERNQGSFAGQNQAVLQNSVIAPAELSDEEVAMLVYGQQEERLARDVYLAMHDQYGLRVFSNIARSEEQHMAEMGSLLDAYGIPQTEGYGELQETYDALIAKGSLSLKDALEVGITIEILDIDDIDASMSKTDNEDILRVYANLRAGSLNHLDAFTRNLEKNGYETAIAWEGYLEGVELEKGHGQGGGNHDHGSGQGGSGDCDGDHAHDGESGKHDGVRRQGGEQGNGNGQGQGKNEGRQGGGQGGMGRW